MAPYQCPKQVLIWSLPTLAVLISLFWYRRRRPSLKSDPGGTAAEQASIGDHPSISRTAGQLLNAIEKARRDLETSQPIAEVEEVRSVELSAKEISVKQTSKVVENQQIPEKISKSKPVKNQKITEEISVKQITCNTSDKVVKNQQITEEISVDQIVCEKSKLVENHPNNEKVSVEQIACKTSDKVVDNQPIIENISVEQIACKKSDKVVKKQQIPKEISVNQVACEESKTVASQQTITGANTSTTNQKQIIKSVAERSSDEVRQDNNCNTDRICERKKGNVVESASVKEGKIAESASVVKEEKIEESDKSAVKDSVENCVKVSKKPVEEVQVQKQEVVALKKDREQPKMALDIKEQQRQQDELSVDRKMELSNESHDDGERDSANHSPAEIMLESPALSNFSDAHSEGSSDSGKGCSDVATPPAGGSSVSEEAEAAEATEAEAEEAGSDAGAEAFGVYEFIIPQHLVGRLIGRHGAFLQEIRGTTHTNLFIKRHPDTNKLKICAVEGAQADIDAALSMIRHKFPLRRYPTLTLEKVTFVQVAPTCELAPEQFRLQLVEGVNNDVILSSLVSAGHMFLQQPTHPSFQQLAALNQVMNANYCYNDSPSLEEPVKDGVCAAPAPMGGWFRAQIVAVNDDEKTVELRFLDYGGYLSCEYTILKKMRYDFLLLPFQAVECCLANVTPTGGPGAVWSEEATLFVQNLIYGKILQAQIYDYTEEGMPLIYLYVTCGNQVVLVNQELVANGFAEPVTPPQAQETQQQQETKVIEE